MLIALFAVFLSFGSAAHAQFTVDMSIADYHARYGILTVGDLAVGERGIVSGGLCVQDDRVYLRMDETLETDPESILALLDVTRLPRGQALVAFRSPEPLYSSDDRQSERRLERMRNMVHGLVRARGFINCRNPLTGPVPDDALLLVVAIDGASSARELLDQIDRAPAD